MGLLDDAIREHLELKRRHGADPGEIAKLEHEAFGAVRRGDARDAPVATQDAPEPAAHEAPDAYEAPEHDVPAAEPEAYDPPPATYDAPGAAPDASDADDWMDDEPPAARGGQETVAFSLSDLDEPAPSAERPSPSTPPAEPEAPTSPPAPSLYSDERYGESPERERRPAEPAEPMEPAPHAEDVVPADEEPGEEDVLEETPDFLQETPEHDRLWFEQKPPRDFDF